MLLTSKNVDKHSFFVIITKRGDTMNISFDWYNVFYYVCELKSVTKAANFLCVSQPAITRHIKDLEKILGKKLIEKNPKGIELTDDGKILYNEIKEPIEKLNATSSSFKEKSGEYNQVIRINAGFSTVRNYVLKVFASFNKRHPDIKFDISSMEYAVSLQRLREGKCDIIFFAMQEVKEEYNNIVIEKWKTVKDELVVSKDVKDKYPDFISVEDLNNYPLICKFGGGTGRKNLEIAFNKAGLEFLPTYQVTHNWLVEEYVKMGLGIGLVVNNLVQKEIDNGEFIPIKTDIELPSRVYGFAYRKDSRIYKVIKEFAEELKKVK